MNNYQSRSQLIRTSLSGNRKSKFLTYNKLPVSYEKIEMYKNELIKNTQNKGIESGKEEINQLNRNLSRYESGKTFSFDKNNNNRNKINLNLNLGKRSGNNFNFNETQVSTNHQATGFSYRVRTSEELFRKKGNKSDSQFHVMKRFSNNDRRNLIFEDKLDPRALIQNQEQNLVHRPRTELNKNRKRINFIKLNELSPLGVINKKIINAEQIINQQNQSNLNFRKSSQQRACKSAFSKNSYSSQTLMHKNQNHHTPQKTFLKKGSSIDRSVLINLLKSKYKQNMSVSVINYSNAKSNDKLNNLIKKQIPNEFRDIIGVEQMLKMSKIMTGLNIKGVNMEQKIQQAISKRINHYKLKTGESNVDEHETLKSIKRW